MNKGQVFWDPDRHRRNAGDHPHYKFKWHFDQINKEVPPDPVKHLKRPLEIGARFSIEKFAWSEYQPITNSDSHYHPEWKGWRVSEPFMNNLTNGRKVYMGEVRPDTSAPIFYPPMGQGWIIPYEERESTKPSTSAQSNNQIPQHLLDVLPYATPEELRAREWRERDMPDMGDPHTWGQLKPRTSPTINQWQEDHVSKQDTTEKDSKAPNPNYKIPKVRKSLQSNTLKELVKEYVSTPRVPTTTVASLSQEREKAKQEREERDKAPRHSKRNPGKGKYKNKK